MPKLPPPPRSAQNRSSFSSADTCKTVAAGGHHLHRDHVVAGPAVATREVAEPAADGEAGDAGGRNEPEHGCQPMQLGLAVDVGQRAAGLRARRAAHRVDPNASQQRHVDHEAALADRKPGDVVAAAAHGTEKPVLTREPNGLHDIDRAGAASHQRRGADRSSRSRSCATPRTAGSSAVSTWPLNPALNDCRGLRREVHCPTVHSSELDRHRSYPPTGRSSPVRPVDLGFHGVSCSMVAGEGASPIPAGLAEGRPSDGAHPHHRAVRGGCKGRPPIW